MISGELSNGLTTSKEIEGATGRFRVVNLKAGNDCVVQLAGAGSERPYGRTLEQITAENFAAGMKDIDIQKLAPGDEVTLVASEAIANLLTPCGIAANGKIADLTANEPAVSQYCLCENLEVSSADGDEILVRIIDRYIKY